MDRRQLPAVHRLMADRRLEDAMAAYGHETTVRAVRMALDERRREMAETNGLISPSSDGTPGAGESTIIDAVVESVLGRLRERWRQRPVRVINATGVILHTNLGRAPLSMAAAAAMAEVAAGYSDLELDLDSGERGSRQAALGGVLAELTGAEAALVVNNNAAATLLVLAGLAAGKKVLVSRGQLIEIGEGFRLPAIFETGGAKLVEVGTTNRTRLADYASAMDEGVGLLLRVHTSSFKVVGFTESVALDELVRLGRDSGVLVVDDLGSGSLLDTAVFGLHHEPLVNDSVAAGADVVTFSGDKLLGGPQAGIIVGRREVVGRLRKHPLTRAMRPGKDVVAGLYATLLDYARGTAAQNVPVWQMIAASAGAIGARAARWQAVLATAGVASELIEGASTIGGGSLPGETLPTTLVALGHGGDQIHADDVARELRTAQAPVVGRIADGRVLLDPRTVLPGEDEALLRTVAEAVGA